MDLLNDIIMKKGSELISSLTSQGFSGDQAKSFLNAAGGNIISAVGSGKVNLAGGDLTRQASALIGNMDIAALASKVGIDSALVNKGLTAIVPMILNLLKDQAGGAEGALGLLSKAKGSGLGDMLNKVF